MTEHAEAAETGETQEQDEFSQGLSLIYQRTGQQER